MKYIIDFIKREAVLTFAVLLAVLSAFIVPPDKEYFSYIDMRTIGLLFALMSVVAGFSKMGVIRKTAESIVTGIKGTRGLVTVLWGLCFFSSMVITNDIALITFVPLAVTVLNICHKNKLIIYTVVLQTIAANLGSMLMPMGNPQNLYIYTKFNVSFSEFIVITFPIIIVSFILLFCATLFVKNENIDVSIDVTDIKGSKGKRIMYTLLGLASILSVVRVIDYRLTVAAVFLCLITSDRSILKRVDWLLLVTFCAFFVFVGNMGRIESVRSFVMNFVAGREFGAALLSSQVISNVPAAVMLSGFTDNYKALILGTDIGGLGTLIASLASLISFKLYSLTENAKKSKYVAVFSCLNIIFIVILILFAVLFY